MNIVTVFEIENGQVRASPPLLRVQDLVQRDRSHDLPLHLR